MRATAVSDRSPPESRARVCCRLASRFSTRAGLGGEGGLGCDDAQGALVRVPLDQGEQEIERLGVLRSYRILDTEAEADFDAEPVEEGVLQRLRSKLDEQT